MDSISKIKRLITDRETKIGQLFRILDDLKITDDLFIELEQDEAVADFFGKIKTTEIDGFIIDFETTKGEIGFIDTQLKQEVVYFVDDKMLERIYLHHLDKILTTCEVMRHMVESIFSEGSIKKENADKLNDFYTIIVELTNDYYTGFCSAFESRIKKDEKQIIGLEDSYKPDQVNNIAPRVYLAYYLGVIPKLKENLGLLQDDYKTLIDLLYDLGIFNEKDNRETVKRVIKGIDSRQGLTDAQKKSIIKNFPKLNPI